MVRSRDEKECVHYEGCSKYAEMTLDWTAADCHDCPTYDPKAPRSNRDRMGRRKLAIIVAWLVPEAEEKDNESIAREIQEELELVPYAERIEKVTVLDVPS